MCNSYSVTKAMLKEGKRAGLVQALTDGPEVWKLIRPTLPGPVISAEVKVAAAREDTREIPSAGSADLPDLPRE